MCVDLVPHDGLQCHQMGRSSLQTPDLPNLTGIALMGGGSISSAATEMSGFVGRAVVAAGRVLITGGRRGAGEAAARGAAVYCEQKGLDPLQWVFSLTPANEYADFVVGRSLSAGQSTTERRILLVQCTKGAIVIGGGTGTADEVLVAVLEAIMNGYSLIPAAGTGGVADRICRKILPFEEAILNELNPSEEKAIALVSRLLSPPCWYCDIDPASVHDKWFFGTRERDPVAQRMYRIRHKYF
jgi:uncharacterized protein (TIGR00725 family)